MAKLLMLAVFALALYVPHAMSKESHYIGTSVDGAGGIEQIWISIEQNGSESMIIYGHVGLPGDDCASGWSCLPMPNFSFAVPEECDSIGDAMEWHYRGNQIRLINALSAEAARSTEAVNVYSVDKEGERVALVFVGSKRGVIGFSYSGDDEKQTFFLMSADGVSVGKCLKFR